MADSSIFGSAWLAASSLCSTTSPSTSKPCGTPAQQTAGFETSPSSLQTVSSSLHFPLHVLRFLTPLQAITVGASGILITKLGYFAPLVILGSVLTTVGSGMIYTFNTTSSSTVWIGYQALAGLGIGLCFQVPIMAGQALSPPKDISATTAIILCKFPPLFLVCQQIHQGPKRK